MMCAVQRLVCLSLVLRNNFQVTDATFPALAANAIMKINGFTNRLVNCKTAGAGGFKLFNVNTLRNAVAQQPTYFFSM